MGPTDMGTTQQLLSAIKGHVTLLRADVMPGKEVVGYKTRTP